MKRKMVKRNEEELSFGFSGCSTERGIAMRIGTEDVAFQMEDMFIKFHGTEYPGAFAYLENDGTITVHNERTYQPNKEEMDEIARENKAIKRLKNGLFAGFIASWILMIPFGFIHEYMPNLLMGLGFVSLGFSKISELIYQYSLRCFGSERMKQTHRFHSAEHATINAFYDLKRVPTIEEVKNYSNYSYYCGMVPYFSQSIPYIVIGLCRLIPGFWYLPALAVAMLLVYLVINKRLYYVEYFSLLEPTDTEYKVAIAALEGALKNKELVDKAREEAGLFFSGGIPVAHFVIEVE